MAVHAVRDQNHVDMIVLYCIVLYSIVLWYVPFHSILFYSQNVLDTTHKLYVRTKIFSM